MPGENEAIKVVVCGAGPVGALTALNAAKRGACVHVYDLRDGMSMRFNAIIRFLFCLCVPLYNIALRCFLTL